ncbi:MAG TPA: cytochrome c, partial [Archangium sp.]
MLKTSLLSLAVLATGCRGWETQERPVHLIKNMDTQEKGKAYRRDSTGLFADGRMMRLPVEGTVAQGQLGDDVLFEDGVDEKGEPSKEFGTGVEEKMDLFVSRGQSRYQIYCAPCHGPNLDGLGTVAGTALDGGPRLLVAPPSLHSERIAKEMVVGKIYSAIKNGVNNGNMPSYAAQIPVEDRWAIVAYVKSEQMKKDSTVPLKPGGIVLEAVTAATAE